jgi:hypothetical protein
MIQGDEVMSMYQPDYKTRYVKKLSDGWYAMDKYGVYEGPYKSAIDAWNAIMEMREDHKQ